MSDWKAGSDGDATMSALSTSQMEKKKSADGRWSCSPEAKPFKQWDTTIWDTTSILSNTRINMYREICPKSVNGKSDGSRIYNAPNIH
jgi:hypothetical protein